VFTIPDEAYHWVSIKLPASSTLSDATASVPNEVFAIYITALGTLPKGDSGSLSDLPINKRGYVIR